MTSKQKRKLRDNIIGYSFILPNIIGYSIFVFLPVCFSFVLCFMKWNGAASTPMEFVGLQNFVQIFNDELFVNSFWHTVSYALMTVLPTLVMSLLLAVLLNSKIKGIPFYRASFFFPYITSTVAIGAVWNMLFQPEFGPINEFLKIIGISNPPGWVIDTDWAMVAVSIVTVWKYMGYYMIVYLGSSRVFPVSFMKQEVWMVPIQWQKFRYITLPMLTPTTFFVLIMLTIQCFKVFDLVYCMTQGGPGNATKTIVNYIYDKAFVNWDLGPASVGYYLICSLYLLSP